MVVVAIVGLAFFCIAMLMLMGSLFSAEERADKEDLAAVSSRKPHDATVAVVELEDTGRQSFGAGMLSSAMGSTTIVWDRFVAYAYDSDGRRWELGEVEWSRHAGTITDIWGVDQPEAFKAFNQLLDRLRERGWFTTGEKRGAYWWNVQLVRSPG